MPQFLITLSSLQDSPFKQEASTPEEAIAKTIERVKHKFPGFFVCIQTLEPEYVGGVMDHCHLDHASGLYVLENIYPAWSIGDCVCH